MSRQPRPAAAGDSAPRVHHIDAIAHHFLSDGEPAQPGAVTCVVRDVAVAAPGSGRAAACAASGLAAVAVGDWGNCLVEDETVAWSAFSYLGGVKPPALPPVAAADLPPGVRARWLGGYRGEHCGGRCRTAGCGGACSGKLRQPPCRHGRWPVACRRRRVRPHRAGQRWSGAWASGRRRSPSRRPVCGAWWTCSARIAWSSWSSPMPGKHRRAPGGWSGVDVIPAGATWPTCRMSRARRRATCRPACVSFPTSRPPPGAPVPPCWPGSRPRSPGSAMPRAAVDHGRPFSVDRA
jgi:hypothetical protein